jgi:NTE family protein
MLERRVDFGEVGVQPEGSYPVLLVGAVDVISGEFRAFNSRRGRISPETILASAAIPTLFRSVHLDDGGTYWDDLFSQNPPVAKVGLRGRTNRSRSALGSILPTVVGSRTVG